MLSLNSDFKTEPIVPPPNESENEFEDYISLDSDFDLDDEDDNDGNNIDKNEEDSNNDFQELLNSLQNDSKVSSNAESEVEIEDKSEVEIEEIEEIEIEDETEDVEIFDLTSDTLIDCSQEKKRMNEIQQIPKNFWEEKSLTEMKNVIEEKMFGGYREKFYQRGNYDINTKEAKKVLLDEWLWDDALDLFLNDVQFFFFFF